MSEKQYAEGMYSTGELAKLCGVTVRTVQYYDTRGLLVPSELTEGGRRMYTEADAEKLKLLTYLRSLGLSIDNIGSILREENAAKVLCTLLEEQERGLAAEVDEKRATLREIRGFLSGLRSSGGKELEDVKDVASIMKAKNKLRKVYTVMALYAALGLLIEAGTVILWIKTGIWWPFAVGMAVIAAGAFPVSAYYIRSVDYICPECHAQFHPGAKEMIFAAHTPKTRKLTCPKCGKKSYCVETAHEEK